MTKLIACGVTILASAVLTTSAFANDAKPSANFETTLSAPMTGSAHVAYDAVQTQVDRACKRQVRSERVLRTRTMFASQCKAELTAAAMQTTQRADVRRYHAAMTGEAARSLLAANTQK